MPLDLRSSLFSTDYDPAEDPPGSIDPLGTLSTAERLAEILFPHLTARMYRLRLLTMATVAAAIAERSTENGGDRTASSLAARLAFERLVVAALVKYRGDLPPQATRGLPGSLLAQNALAAREPLTPANFLRGQAVNGASGVMMRLARGLNLLDDRGGVASAGRELLLLWAEQQDLAGFCDDASGGQREGARWALDVTRATTRSLAGEWPGPGQNIWLRLAEALRLDRLKGRERLFLKKRLSGDSPVRARMLESLAQPGIASLYRGARQHGRGVAERAALLACVREASLQDPISLTIRHTVNVIDHYEQAANLAERVFDTLTWGLKLRGGRASRDTLVKDRRISHTLGGVHRALCACLPPFRASIHALVEPRQVCDTDTLAGLRELVDDLQLAAASAGAMTDVVLARHEKVQRRKGKAMWIDREGTQWLLMPGRGFEGEEPPPARDAYLHPFRVENAYAFLTDLGLADLQVDHEATE